MPPHYWVRFRTFASVVLALILPGGLVIVPLVHLLMQRRKSRSGVNRDVDPRLTQQGML